MPWQCITGSVLSIPVACFQLQALVRHTQCVQEQIIYSCFSLSSMVTNILGSMWLCPLAQGHLPPAIPPSGGGGGRGGAGSDDLSFFAVCVCCSCDDFDVAFSLPQLVALSIQLSHRPFAKGA